MYKIKNFVFAGLIIILMISITAPSIMKENSVSNILSNDNSEIQTNLDLESLLSETSLFNNVESSEIDSILLYYTDDNIKENFLKKINILDNVDTLEFNNLPFISIKSSTEFIDKFKVLDLQEMGLRVYENTKITLAETEMIYESFDQSKLSASDDPLIVTGIGATDLVSEGITGDGIKLAILDTGIYKNHPDLNVVDEISFVTTEYGFDDNETAEDLAGHGTHVAGIATGSGSGISLFRGVAPGVDLYNIKVLDKFGVSNRLALLGAIDYAITEQMDIISLSLGYDYSDPLDPISIAIDDATESGIVCTISAGNSGSNFKTIGTPGSSKSAITVGASDYEGNVVSFSSRGPSKGNLPDPDVIAPGSQIISALAKYSLTDYGLSLIEPTVIYSASNGAKYFTASGTSMSAPMVAGAVALLLQKHNSATPLQIRAALQNSAVDLGYDDMVQGFGLVNTDLASEYLSNQIQMQSLLSVAPKENFFLINDSTIIQVAGEEYNSPIVFPGEEIVTTFSIISPYADLDPTTLEVTGSAAGFISLPSDIPQEEPNIVSTVPISLSIPYDVAEGEYSAIIKISNSNQDVEIPVGPFNVKYPISRIYWDNFHSLGGSTLNNSYLAFETIARNLQIQIVEFNKVISNFNLSTFSTLVIPDIIIPLSNNEVNNINNFLNQGNDLILLADNPHLSLITEYNQLITNYGLNFTEALVKYDDMGWAMFQESLNLPVTVESPLITNETLVLSDIWKGGTLIEIIAESDSEIVATVTTEGFEYGAVGVFASNSTHKEKIIVIGDNHLLSGQKITYDLNILYRSIFDFLIDNEEISVALLKNDSSSEIHIYGYITDITGSPIHNDSWVVNNSIKFPNSTVLENFELDYFVDGRFALTIDNVEEGIFEFTTSINLVNYTVVTLIESGMELLGYENYIEIKNSNHYTLSTEGFLLRRDETTLLINISPIDDPTIEYYDVTGVISPFPELQLYEMNTIKKDIIQSINLEFSNILHVSNFTASWELPSTIRSGFFTIQYEIKGYNSEDQVINSKYYYLIFEIANETPKIDKSVSLIGNVALEEFNPDILYNSWSLGDKIEFSISGSDDRENVECFVAFLSLEFFNGVIPEYLDFITLTQENEYWKGNYTLPAVRTIPLEKYDITIKAESDQIFVFLIILRDSDGYYTYSQISFRIMGSYVDTSEIMFLFFMILIPTSIIIGISLYFYSKKKKISDTDPYSYIQENLVQKQKQSRINQQISSTIIHPKFCGFCGGKIAPGVKFCIKCGKKLITLDDLGIKDIDYKT